MSFRPPLRSYTNRFPIPILRRSNNTYTTISGESLCLGCYQVNPYHKAWCSATDEELGLSDGDSLEEDSDQSEDSEVVSEDLSDEDAWLDAEEDPSHEAVLMNDNPEELGSDTASVS